MIEAFSLVWFFASIASAVFIIWPRPNWPVVANRWRAGAVFFMIFIGGPMLIGQFAPPSFFDKPRPPPPPAPVGKTPAQLAAEARARAERQAQVELLDMRFRPAKFLALEQASARKGGLDLVFFLSGQIRSTSRLGVKDPVIQCDLYTETDTSLGHVRQTLYKFVLAGQSTSFDDLNMGFADSRWERYDCHVVGATVLASQ